MSQEINLSLALTGFKPSVMGTALSRAIQGFIANMSGNFFIEGNFTAGITATAVPLGGVTSPHFSYWLNTDPTNYVQLFNGASGAVFGRLQAGEPSLIALDPTCVPFAKANTAPCVVEYVIFSL